MGSVTSAFSFLSVTARRWWVWLRYHHRVEKECSLCIHTFFSLFHYIIVLECNTSCMCSTYELYKRESTCQKLVPTNCVNCNGNCNIFPIQNGLHWTLWKCSHGDLQQSNGNPLGSNTIHSFHSHCRNQCERAFMVHSHQLLFFST